MTLKNKLAELGNASYRFQFFIVLASYLLGSWIGYLFEQLGYETSPLNLGIVCALGSMFTWVFAWLCKKTAED